MIGEPLISVIIPTYKRSPDLIKRSVKSVLNQTYTNIELIIVDDSPSDFEDREKVSAFITGLNDSRIIYIRHDENKGANAARNTGIKISNGEFCAFLDDDDEWMLDKLEKQILKFSNPEIGLVYCKAIEIDEITGKVTLIINEMHHGFQYHRLLKQNFIGSNSFVLIRRKILKEIGAYDESLPSNQDYDLFLRIAQKYQIDCVTEVLVKYYVHEGERISTNPYKLYEGRAGLYEKYRRDIESDNELSIIWRIKSVPLLYRIGEKKEGMKHLIQAFIESPSFTFKYLIRTLNYMLKRRKPFNSRYNMQ